MKMRSLLSLLAALMVGFGALLSALCGTTCYSSGFDNADEPGFSIHIDNECDTGIYGLTHCCTLRGEVVSGGGMCRADNGPIPEGDRCDFRFTDEDFGGRYTVPRNDDRAALTMSFSVLDKEGGEHPCSQALTIEPHWATDYYYELNGDYAHGFTLTPGGQDDRAKKRIKHGMGIEVDDLRTLSFTDTHGGSHGDGETLAALSCPRPEFEGLAGKWRPLPLPESLSIARHSVPIADDTRGFWLFFDRSSESTDPKDAFRVDKRHSYDISLLVYDSDRSVLYYYELDT